MTTQSSIKPSRTTAFSIPHRFRNTRKFLDQAPAFFLSSNPSLSCFPLFPMDKSFEAIIDAAICFVVIILLMIMICRLHKHCRGQDQAYRCVQARALSSRTQTELSSIPVNDSAAFDPRLRISMDELVAATKNFSADLVVSDGSFGFVYKAQLSNGVTVAIKKLHPDAFRGFREFRAEMDTLGKLQHRNIVKFLGYCVSGPDRVLVYEYIDRGSLDQWLHDTSYDVSSPSVWGARRPLSWETRVKIVKGVANGLAYCHGLEWPIVHRDIKASNVLLDSEFEAHIVDFGLARSIDSGRSHVSTQVAGTMGYLPPEYKDGLTGATVKADVYSFGILMLETATGKQPYLPVAIDGKQVSLVQWVAKMVSQIGEIEMVDRNIWTEGLVEAYVKEYFEIAGACTSDNPRDRPAMAQVVELLGRIPS